jgi:hypothetical protein
VYRLQEVLHTVFPSVSSEKGTDRKGFFIDCASYFTWSIVPELRELILLPVCIENIVPIINNQK